MEGEDRELGKLPWDRRCRMSLKCSHFGDKCGPFPTRGFFLPCLFFPAELVQVLSAYYDRILECESHKYDLEYEVRRREFEVLLENKAGGKIQTLKPMYIRSRGAIQSGDDYDDKVSVDDSIVHPPLQPEIILQ